MDKARLNRLIRKITSLQLIPQKLRIYLLRITNYQIGNSCKINGGSSFIVTDLHLGDRSFIGRGSLFNGAIRNQMRSSVYIGKDVMIAYNVTFCCGTHQIGDKNRRAGESYNLPIFVGDGCWIGTGAIILGGTNISSGCVIAAGAVVTNDCEQNCLYAGVPAKK